jgi:hypothetical protein
MLNSRRAGYLLIAQAIILVVFSVSMILRHDLMAWYVVLITVPLTGLCLAAGIKLVRRNGHGPAATHLEAPKAGTFISRQHRL